MSPDFGRSVKSPFPQKRLWETISHFIKVPLCPGNEQCAWKLKYAEGENCKFETNNTLQSSETPCDFVFANKSIEHGQNFVYCPCKIHPTPRNALFVRSYPTIFTPSGWHGLSARRARRTKSRWPEGPPTRSWGPEGPLTSSFIYFRKKNIFSTSIFLKTYTVFLVH